MHGDAVAFNTGWQEGLNDKIFDPKPEETIKELEATVKGLRLRCVLLEQRAATAEEALDEARELSRLLARTYSNLPSGYLI